MTIRILSTLQNGKQVEIGVFYVHEGAVMYEPLDPSPRGHDSSFRAIANPPLDPPARL
jgi:hypothetical protein